jgi:hypothetical protein
MKSWNVIIWMKYPKPSYRENNRDNQKTWSFELEYYFKDEDIKKYYWESSCKDSKIWNTEFTVIETKKKTFTKNILENIDSYDFTWFKILFDKIQKLMNI